MYTISILVCYIHYYTCFMFVYFILLTIDSDKRSFCYSNRDSSRTLRPSCPNNPNVRHIIFPGPWALDSPRTCFSHMSLVHRFRRRSYWVRRKMQFSPHIFRWRNENCPRRRLWKYGIVVYRYLYIIYLYYIVLYTLLQTAVQCIGKYI